MTSPPQQPSPDVSERVYRELRQLAAWYIASESPGHTLQPTALVHEAYVRMSPGLGVDGLTRTQFMALAARVMRNVLVDHARRHQAAKRGGSGSGCEAAEAAWRRVPLEDAESSDGGCAAPDILALHDALERLAALSDRQAKVVEARFFAGLSVEHTAEVLGVSPRTVEADWRIARAWLARELNPRTTDPGAGL
ncbi:hypothetical protein PHYC_00249 [Phycisphaerales bacterium]|nr:hypothetical protein PHYC_00249 [Phycisphaerales bacterium]